MAANFPGNPAIGDTVTIENIRRRWTGNSWSAVSKTVRGSTVQSNNGTIDLSKGNYHKIAIDSGNATVTVSFTNVSSGSSKWFLELNVSASYTITWPASVIWEADTAPATTGSQTLILEFYTSDSGTTIYGVESINKDNTPVYSFQGSVSGYTSGGGNPGQVNTIDKFSFSIDGNATDVGDLTTSTHSLAGQSSNTNGYTSGGRNPLDPINIISKFPFSTDSNATDVGDLTVTRQSVVGQSSSENGYTSGGNDPPTQNVIDKFPFASDGNATDVGDLSVGGTLMASQSSETSGYTSGGYGRGTVIDKFPFAADANATDVGDLTQSRYSIAGQSSTVSGYTSGGINTTPPSATRYNTIDKFPFASNANATDVGDLTETKGQHAGQSSTSNGYVTGGISPSVANLNVIEKFPFATDANATDVGDLTQGRRESPAGQQV